MRNKVFGKNINTIYLMLTEQCPCSCEYCYIKDKDSSLCLSIEQIEEALSMLSCEKPRIIFFGGEPLLKLDLIRYVVSNFPNCELQVVTSATVNFEEFIKDIYLPNKDKFDLQVSWDGLDSSTRRLKDGSIVSGIWDKINWCQEEGALIQIRCVLNDTNIKNMFDTFKRVNDVYQKYNSICIDFTIAHQPFMNDSFVKYFSEQSIKILNYCSENKSIIPQMLQQYLLQIICKEPSTSCDAGNYLVIRPNGDIYPCTILSQFGDYFKIGNVSNKKNINFSPINDMRKSVILNECEDCNYSTYCDGGCRYERFYNFKENYSEKVCSHHCNNMNLYYYLDEWYTSLSNEKRGLLISIISNKYLYLTNYMLHLDNSRAKRLMSSRKEN